MRYDHELVLCGGTYTFLVLAAIKEISKRRGQNNGGITQPNCLIGLIDLAGVVRPYTPIDSDVSTAVTRFKSCTHEASDWMLISNTDYINHVDNLVKTEYPTILHAITLWADKYLDLQKNGDWLCKALIELAYFDETVDMSDQIYAKQDGSLISFDDLIKQDEIHLQPLLLGMWHYVLKRNVKNVKGKQTIAEISVPVGEKKSVRKVEKFLGNSTGISFKVRILKVNKLPVNNENGASLNKVVKLLGPEEDAPDDRELLPGMNDLIGFSDNEIALSDTAYKEFLDSEYSAYRDVKTLLFHNEPRDFESIYLCNDVIRDGFVQYNAAAFFDDPDYTSSVNRNNAVVNFSFAYMEDQRLSYVLLTGIGGLGKSMMMRHLLLDAIEGFDDYRVLPLFIPLKDYRDNHMTILRFTYEIFDSFADGISEEEYTDLLRAGRFLLLFDGLDEVKESCRENFDIELNKFVNKYRRNHFIISSRPNSNFAGLHRFVRYNILPFTKEQAINLISKLDLGKQDEEIKQGFLKELDATLYETHKAYVENPLLLTIMLLTYKQKTIIPTEMHKFYEKAFDTLFCEHDNIKVGYKREYKTKLKQDKFARYMAEFCFLSYQEEVFNPSDEDCLRYFEEMEIEEEDRARFTWKDFIDDIVNCVCLMYEEGQRYHFIHRSIQEYFCACYFSNLPDSFLTEVGEFFEGKRTRNTDKTFDMLYAMKKQSVEEMIFIPFLEELLKTENQIKPPSYSSFLMRVYPVLYITTGEVPYEDITTPDSFIYRFIAERNGYLTNPYDVVYDFDVDAYDEFIYSEYVKYDDDYMIHEDDETGFVYADHGSGEAIVLRGDVPPDYIQYFDEPEVCGRSYEVTLKEVFEQEPYYIEIEEWLNADTNAYKIEFERTREYLKQLQKQRSEKKESLHDKLKKKRLELF